MSHPLSASLQSPMPVAGSGVMLVEYSVPKGVSKATPPAMKAPAAAVWQLAQFPAVTR